MRTLNALSLTIDVENWLITSHTPRILHVFDRVCNLMNERREVLSIVTPQIGEGPFHVVIEDEICFLDDVNLQSPIDIRGDRLALANITIDLAHAKRWNPCPDWERLHTHRDEIAGRLSQLQTADHELDLPQSLVASLFKAIATADLSAARAATSTLAGLGIGLTPSGDDVTMGALYAAWIIHPREVAGVLGREVAQVAAPLTTSLSAAWLRSAGKGEAGILWHEFFNALMAANALQMHEMMDHILAVGETSGADALSGFFGSFLSWVQTHE